MSTGHYAIDAATWAYRRHSLSIDVRQSHVLSIAVQGTPVSPNDSWRVLVAAAVTDADNALAHLIVNSTCFRVCFGLNCTRCDI
jgi:hypothetical protein